MKKILYIISCMYLMLAMTVTAAWGLDYAQMTTEELFQLHGAVQNASEIERKEYQLEWEKRVATMTDEEKQQYLTSPGNSPEDDSKNPKLLWTPGRGYEKGTQGQVIFGGAPRK